MDERLSIVKGFYAESEEDTRLQRSRHGQLEYATTMEYIHRFLKPGDRIAELGAGTGRYSIALAKEGYDITAVELVEKNLEVLRKNAEALFGKKPEGFSADTAAEGTRLQALQGDEAAEGPQLRALQGDATDLAALPDESFDMTLSLGPMYHLYDPADVRKAIREALRVTKRGGVVITAFLSVYAILFDNYLKETLHDGMEENFDEQYRTRHYAEQLFTGYDITEFEELFRNEPVEHLATAAADTVLELAEDRTDFSMSDEAFSEFLRYHLATCEKRELLGASSHLLYICRKK
ncbi:MAG: class I SAM-dependent methyltransferase [Lachnospiraceae bacterium]|nr:class I SAM-dependent methyltransferase [Lachnospiraceae bacterium]